VSQPEQGNINYILDLPLENILSTDVLILENDDLISCVRKFFILDIIQFVGKVRSCSVATSGLNKS